MFTAFLSAFFYSIFLYKGFTSFLLLCVISISTVWILGVVHMSGFPQPFAFNLKIDIFSNHCHFLSCNKKCKLVIVDYPTLIIVVYYPTLMTGIFICNLAMAMKPPDRQNRMFQASDYQCNHYYLYRKYLIKYLISSWQLQMCRMLKHFTSIASPILMLSRYYYASHSLTASGDWICSYFPLVGGKQTFPWWKEVY